MPLGRLACAFIAIAALSSTAVAQTPVPVPKTTVAEGIQLLAAAGFRLQGNQILDGCDMPATPQVKYFDIDGKGTVAATVEDSGPCYGMAGEYFAVLNKLKNGKWQAVINQIGMLGWQTTRNRSWRDIEAGGLGNCFPIWRYNGREYALYKQCPS
jgi:hypothetical protein